MSTEYKKIALLFVLLLPVMATVDAGMAFGQTSVALQPIQSLFTQTIPGAGAGGQNAASVLQYLFTVSIALAGVFAVLMIVIGGIEYLLSEAFTSKTEAIKRIQAALWGLLIILASYVILNTINPNLLDLKLTLPDARNSALPGGGSQTISSPTTNSGSSSGGVVCTGSGINRRCK